jgi:DNA-binding XRE family transcriptional regulator
MTPAELRSFRAKHKLRQEDLAQLLGVTRLTIARWEVSLRPIPSYLNLALEGLALHLPATRKRRAAAPAVRIPTGGER